jgi:hypothetical protein
MRSDFDYDYEEKPASGCFMGCLLVIVLTMGGALGVAILWAIGKAVTR